MDVNEKQSFGIEDVTTQISVASIFLIFLAVLWGAVIGLILLPDLLPGLSQSILSAQPKVYWYLARGSALVAYGLLWLSLVLGVTVTNKLAARWPGLAKSNELHQFVSILGLAFGLFHGLILLGDQYSNFSIIQILLPFSTSTFRPLWVGLGQIGFYLWAIVLGSFYIRRKIGFKTWRVVHYFSYLIFLSVLMHALFAGTDVRLLGTQIYYWVTGGLLLFLTVYRIFDEIETAAEKKQKLLAIREFQK